MITLRDGRQFADDQFVLNEANYHVTLAYSGEDVTNEITRAQKLKLFPGLDVQKENIRASVEKVGTGGGKTATAKDLEPLTTNTFEIFGQQVEEDGLLGAPLETLDSTVKQIFSSSGIKTILILAAIGFAAVVTLRK